jgi:tRNA threonylcarbamoyl adenosine modification protein YeaZ
MLIALEAVDRNGSACAWRDGPLAFVRCPGPAEAHLVALADRLMREHGPATALAVAAGPGSFTGLRVAAIAARTIAWLDRLPVHPVDSLAACAVAQGDGLWWVLLPLKRDTTFRALIRVVDGRPEALQPTLACRDDGPGPAELPSGAVAIGPALAQKPELAARWLPGVALGDPAGPDARGVARAAPHVAPVPWDRVLPLYHQEPAPVLQRQAARQASPA